MHPEIVFMLDDPVCWARLRAAYTHRSYYREPLMFIRSILPQHSYCYRIRSNYIISFIHNNDALEFVLKWKWQMDTIYIPLSSNGTGEWDSLWDEFLLQTNTKYSTIFIMSIVPSRSLAELVHTPAGLGYRIKFQSENDAIAFTLKWQ